MLNTLNSIDIWRDGRKNLLYLLIYWFCNNIFCHIFSRVVKICYLAPKLKHFFQDGPFNWDETTQGYILGSFFYGYIVTQIPGGRLAEIFGGKWIFGIGVLITSVFTLLTPLAAKLSVYALIAVRVIEGLWIYTTFIPYMFGLGQA